MRDPKRSRGHFEAIYHDFLCELPWAGRVVLDIGPGQYDLGEILKPRGALVEGVDNDAAVLELGRYKGYRVIEGNLRRLSNIDFGRRYDGLFCKLSLNVFWTASPVEARADVERLFALAHEDAWLWIAPWNGVPKNADPRAPFVGEMLAAQRAAFRARGCDVLELPEELTYRYGTHGNTASWPIFTRGIRIPPALERYRVKAA